MLRPISFTKLGLRNFFKTIVRKPVAPAGGAPWYQVVDHAWQAGRVDEQSARPVTLKCSVCYNKYGGYCVPDSSSHRFAAKAVLSGEVYEPKTIEYIMANCGDRDIIHAGAFFGDFLPALSAAVSPNSIVWAFEPNPENFRCAKITLDLNAASNVRLFHAGVGARNQRLFVRTADSAGRSLGGASHITDKARDDYEKQPVQVLAIDDAIPEEREIGILHLDVEGYEKEALSGALKTIRRCRPILIIEMLPKFAFESSDWFVKTIRCLGYEKVAHLHGNAVYSSRARVG